MAKKSKEGHVDNPDQGVITPEGTIEPIGLQSNGDAEPATNETKGQKWKRLAQRRVNRCLKDLSTLIPLASRAQYDYTDEQVKAMTAALDSAMADIEAAYSGQKKSKPQFVLD